MLRRASVFLVASLLGLCLGTVTAEIRLDRSSQVLIALGDEDRRLKVVQQVTAAAEELAQRLTEICGAKANVGAYDPDFAGVVIHVGLTPFAARQNLGLESLDLEGFVIKTSGNNILLAGRTPLGTRHAVYTFLERHCGVRWFFPGDLGTYVPKRGEIVLPDIRERSNPAFLARYFTIHGKDEARRWERRNRLQDHWTVRLKGNSHAMASIIPTRVYGIEHPEYFALRKGQRQVPESSRQEVRAAYCLTNREVIDVCAKWVIDYFDRRPGNTSVSMAMNDTSAYCECDRCEVEGVRGAVDGPNYADRYFTFVNRVARKVKAKHPDKLIGVLAYGGARVLPNRLKKLEDNVNVYLVAGGPGHDFDTDARGRRRELIRQWSGFAGSLCVYGYQFGTSGDRFFQIPTFYPHLAARDLRFLRYQGVKGCVTEMLPFWAFSPKPWLMAKLLWDPGQSVDALLADFCRSMFGQAEPAMAHYFGLLEQVWLLHDPGKAVSSSDAQYALIEPYLDRIDTILNFALRKAEGKRQEARVQFFADGIKTTRLFIDSCTYARQLTMFPATAKEVFGAVWGARRLYQNEIEIAQHRELLEQKYGIQKTVIAPREKGGVVRDVLERCAKWFEQHGFDEEAELIRGSPAAELGREGLVDSQKATARELALAAGLVDGDDEDADEPETPQDALEQVLKRKEAVLAAVSSKTAPPAPRAPLVRFVDRSETAVRTGAKLLLRESFDDQRKIDQNGATTYGTPVFQPGVSGAAVELREKHALIAYPLTKLNPYAGTIELFVKTRWAGRLGSTRVNLVCTGGNFDPPGHLSIGIKGEGRARSVTFALYCIGQNNYVMIPMEEWREDEWYHVAAMWRIDPKRPEANILSLHVNGKPGKPRFAMTRARDIKLTGPLGIGNRPVSFAFMEYPMVVLDELRVYDRPIPVNTLSFAPSEQAAADGAD